MILNIHQRRERARRGFTLMEMLVVVAIIVALAGLGGYYFLGQLNQAKKSAAKAQISTLTTAAENYKMEHSDQWPPNLLALTQKDELGFGPYLKTTDALTDPWGKPYNYQQGSSEQPIPLISCLAPDGTIITLAKGPTGQ